MDGFMQFGLMTEKLIRDKFILMVNLTGKVINVLPMEAGILLLEGVTEAKMAILAMLMKSQFGIP